MSDESGVLALASVVVKFIFPPGISCLMGTGTEGAGRCKAEVGPMGAGRGKDEDAEDVPNKDEDGLGKESFPFLLIPDPDDAGASGVPKLT